jgi:hypothetical protein
MDRVQRGRVDLASARPGSSHIATYRYHLDQRKRVVLSPRYAR